MGTETGGILTPDRRLRVYVSAVEEEMAAERQAVRDAVDALRLSPVLVELGARPYSPRALAGPYIEQSDISWACTGRGVWWVGPVYRAAVTGGPPGDPPPRRVAGLAGHPAGGMDMGDRIRSRMGDEAFRQACAEGARMTAVEAIALAQRRPAPRR